MFSNLMSNAPSLRLVLGAVCLFALPTVALFRIYFHPLSQVPGPRLWAASGLPHLYHLLSGNLVHRIKELHDQYGVSVRIAPNEVSFCSAEAFKDVYSQRPKHTAFPKVSQYADPPSSREKSITEANAKDHKRIRTHLGYAFTEAALREQEPILQAHVEILTDELSKIAQNPENCVNIKDWMQYAAFDIIGDLCFADKLDTLRSSKNHPWVESLFDFSLVGILVQISTSIIDNFPLLASMLKRFIPSDAFKRRQKYDKLTREKIQSRMAIEDGRPDFMTVVRRDRMDEDARMTQREIEETFKSLILAGSETTATTLAGTTNLLLRYPEVHQRLKEEVRGAFLTTQEITFAKLEKLQYLNATLKEGFRLTPPVPCGIPRVVPRGGDTVCCIWLPEKTHVSVQHYSSNRSKLSWKWPDTCAPERWLPGNQDPSSAFFLDKRAALQPFSLGPHSCLAKPLAWAELRLILARVIYEFDMEPLEEWKFEDQRTYQLWEKEPYRMRMRAVVKKN